jgi:hypothetical protein
MRQLGFVGPTYTQQSVSVDAQRTLNLYPEVDESGFGKNGEIASLVGTPGLLRLATAGAGPCRGLHYVSRSSRAFMVSGAELYEITDAEAPVLRATLDTTRGFASMADNGAELCIVDGTSLYLYTLATDILSKPDTPGFSGATRIGFQDGYFIVNRGGTQQFFLSGLFNGTSWDALDVESKEGEPDNLLSLVSDHRELWLFGERTTEVWFNSGAADSPFQRIQNAFLQEGIAGANLVEGMDNSLFWVKRDRNGQYMVMRANGYVGTRVSTFPLEEAMAGYGDLGAGTMWSYLQRGHSFLCINFPNADRTWCFDAATQLWHERDYTPPDGKKHTRHRAEHHILLGTRHIVGDYQNGNIYELSETTRTDNSAPITRLRDTPFIAQEGKRLFFPVVQLDMESGLGMTSGQDPKVVLSWTDDGGHTYSDERQTSAGKVGEYQARARWTRCGSSRGRSFRVKITDPIKVTLISGYGGVVAGAH